MENGNSLVKNDPGELQIQSYVLDSGSGYRYDHAATASADSQKHQFLRVVSILRKRWPLILVTTLLITGVVVYFEAQKPDYYRSKARIQVNNEMNPAAGGNGAGAIVLNSGGDPGYFTTQLQILEGTGLLRRVAKSMDLEHNDAFLNPNRASSRTSMDKVLRVFGMGSVDIPEKPASGTDPKPSALDLKPETLSELDKQAEVLAPYVNVIKKGLTVMPVKDQRTANKETRLIEVEFVHEDAVTSSKVANAIADVYVLQNLERKVESNASASDFLQKRVADLQSEIRSSEERLMNYARSNRIISLDASQNTVVQRLADLNAKLGMAENDRIASEAAYRAAMQNPLSGTAAESADPRTSAIEGQLTTLRQQLAQLKTEFTDEWPEVKRINRQIAQLEAEIQSTRQRAKSTQTARLEQAFKEASAREQELRNNFEAQRAAVLQQNEAAINYRIIEQEVNTNRGLLTSLLQKSRETEVVLNGTPNNVYVADRAMVPTGAEGPQRSKRVMLAFLCSLFIGVCLAFLVNWLDDSVQVLDDIEAQLGTPVIGRIPGLNEGVARRLIAKPGRLLGKRNGAAAMAPYVVQQPRVAEEFNQLRASLLLATVGKMPRTVLVTSAQPSEGKTFTSLNLAKSLAQLGGKVLLIDADLRCPKQHLISHVPNERGLSTLLDLSDATSKDVNDTVAKNIFENLDLLTSGPNVPHPASHLGQANMKSLLNRLTGMYQYVVIDSPPVLYFADSIMLASLVDSVMLVGRVNFSSKEMLALAKKKLQGVHANVVGIVLNDVPGRSFSYSNHEYYRQFDEVAENGNGGGKFLDLDR